MKADEVIIFSDMDGTLLTDWSLGPYIPQVNLDAIQRFSAAGGLFSVASGRQYNDTFRYFGDIRFSTPSVQVNGAIIYDNAEEKILKKILLPEEVKHECLDYFLKHKCVWLVAANEHETFQVLSGDSKRDSKLNDIKRKFMTATEYHDSELVKVCFVIFDPEHLSRTAQDIRNFESNGLFTLMQSSPFFLELLEKKAGKAAAIKKVIAHIGAQDRTLVCIGDYDNDLEMLALADIAACPENASEQVHKIAGLKTCSNNKGALAELISQLEML